MTLRNILFWMHLVLGVVAGIIILVMSATGVLLTYERQLVELAERTYAVSGTATDSIVSTDELMTQFQAIHPQETHFYVRHVNRPGAVFSVWAGPHGYFVHPHDGNVLRDGPSATQAFFSTVTAIHRWFAMEGENKKFARMITGYSNLLFLFLIVTGIYLWFPKRWRWTYLKPRMLFSNKVKTTKARDFNWHHVFSFWMLIPLFFISLSATIFYFPWASSALYGAYGEEVPNHDKELAELETLEKGKLGYEDLFDIAKQHAAKNGAADWYSIWMEVGEIEGQARFYIDRSLGRRPEYAYALFLDMDDGSVLEVKRNTDWSRGDQAWDVARFGHTGELFGFVGQTIAGLASLASCFLVYTGLALAWRRLILRG